MESKINKSFDTLTEAIQDLNKRGYTADFVVLAEKECIMDRISNISLSPKEFEIDETYRFEGETDPGDEMILFAISSKNNQIKGIVVNAYGMYADESVTQIMNHLQKHIPT